MNLYIYTICGKERNQKFTQSLTVGDRPEDRNYRTGVVSPEIEALVSGLEINTFDGVPDELLDVTFKDENDREWKVEPTWGITAEGGIEPGYVWSQLEITLQPAGGVS